MTGVSGQAAGIRSTRTGGSWRAAHSSSGVSSWYECLHLYQKISTTWSCAARGTGCASWT
ncbi:hypothetical protein GXW82_26830 [Streptacidiphilus sp. 4-A2]|nr:hypothetical protein [Streptacidiphilus sp. 4-A2]